MVAMILAAAVVLMHFVLQMGGEVRQRTHTVATVGRLAEQFRRDVHQARGEPVIAADHRAAELHLPGGRIVKWRIDEPHGLIRTEARPHRRRRPRRLVRPAQRHDGRAGIAAAGGGADRNDSHRFAGHGRAFAGDRSPGIPR